MSKPLPPSRTADQFIVRFPDGMRDRIAEAAKAAGRSMNAEIVARLESSFSAPAQDAWADVIRIEAEYSAAGMFLTGVQQQLAEAQAELEQARASGVAKRILEARQSMIDVLTPLQQSAFDEWLALGDKLRLAKHQAMGIKPRGSPTDDVARRLFGREWDDMPSPPSLSPPAVEPESESPATTRRTDMGRPARPKGEPK